MSYLRRTRFEARLQAIEIANVLSAAWFGAETSSTSNGKAPTKRTANGIPLVSLDAFMTRAGVSF